MKRYADLIKSGEEHLVKEEIRNTLRGTGDLGEQIDEKEVNKIYKKLKKRWDIEQ